MRAVVQRVSEATLSIGGALHAQIGPGLVALIGIERTDTAHDRARMADKIAQLRVFTDESGRMNRSVLDIAGQVLAVPNFTVAGSTRKGRRPSFDAAMRPPQAQDEFDALVAALVDHGVRVGTGVFGADMAVTLTNDGPVTLIVQS